MPADRPIAVTIKEIAAKAGFSHAAVSSVLNGRAAERRISPDTVKRVEHAARELGYVANIAARRLRSHQAGTSQAVLAVITSFETPLVFVSRAAAALQRMIEERGAAPTRFSVTVEMFHAGRLRELHGILTNDRFSGALIANTVEADDRFLAQARIPFPVVLIDRRVPGYASVVESSETGSEAARLLIASGCERCAVLMPALATQVARARLRDFADALALAGRGAPLEIVAADRGERAGCEAMAVHLSGATRADGVFAINDSLAVGAYHAVREAGRSIPQDVCFVGIGDGDASPYLAPPLTCVGSSDDALHREAASLLFRQFDGAMVPLLPIHLPLRIHPGRSTCPAQARRPAGAAEAKRGGGTAST